METMVQEKTMMVTKVNVGGQEVDLGSEMSVNDAMSMMDNLGMGDYTQGTSPVVHNGTLSFEMVNGEKGNK